MVRVCLIIDPTSPASLEYLRSLAQPGQAALILLPPKGLSPEDGIKMLFDAVHPGAYTKHGVTVTGPIYPAFKRVKGGLPGVADDPEFDHMRAVHDEAVRTEVACPRGCNFCTPERINALYAKLEGGDR